MLEKEIFISHSSKDKEIAEKLYDDLLSAGYPVWMDKALEEAEEWKPQIEDHLRSSNRFLVLISSCSVASKWVLHEGSMAYALGQHIIPLKIEAFRKDYSADNLPIWVQEIQLVNFVGSAFDYFDHVRTLKQLLGDARSVQKLLDEMVIHYELSGVLLSEVALNLIDKHSSILIISEKAKELIEKSRRSLLDYWKRYENLEKSYAHAKDEIQELNKDKESLNKDKETLNQSILFHKSDAGLLNIMFLIVYVTLALYWLIVVMYPY